MTTRKPTELWDVELADELASEALAYLAHRIPGEKHCEEPQAYASSFCKEHILQWRNLPIDWKKFVSNAKEHE